MPVQLEVGRTDVVGTKHGCHCGVTGNVATSPVRVCPNGTQASALFHPHPTGLSHAPGKVHCVVSEGTHVWRIDRGTHTSTKRVVRPGHTHTHTHTVTHTQSHTHTHSHTHTVTHTHTHTHTHTVTHTHTHTHSVTHTHTQTHTSVAAPSHDGAPYTRRVFVTKFCVR